MGESENCLRNVGTPQLWAELCTLFPHIRLWESPPQHLRLRLCLETAPFKRHSRHSEADGQLEVMLPGSQS